MVWRSSKLVMVDWLLAVVLSGLTLATLFSQTPDDVGWTAAVVSVLTVAPIALRQSYPVWTMTVILAAVALIALLTRGDLPGSGIGIVVAMFTVGMLRLRVVSAVMFVASLAVLALVFLTTPGSFLWPQFVQSILTVLGAWVIGESTKLWAQRTQRLASRAERAVADERARLARELHDVVAHHISVISLQAGVAEYVLESDRLAAREAIGVVNRSGREALAEMRRLLNVLRADAGDDTSLRPQPGVGDVDELVRRVSSAGLPVDCSVRGRVRELPPGIGLCVFRVTQESLTNVLKHAGPARATVDLHYGDESIRVTVADDGVGTRGTTQAVSAHGVRGMRERAELYGGLLSAGPRDGGGFQVTLTLPLEQMS